MSFVTELLQGIDLSAVGQKLLSLVNTSDPLFVAIVLAILVFLGAKMSGPFPGLRSWGLRLAAAAFLVHLGYIYFAQGIESKDLPHVLLRAANTAGFVLAPLWICFPVLLFVYARLRLALAAFLVYAGYAWFTSEVRTVEILPWVALQAGVASALALLVAWILQPVTDFVAKNLFPRKATAAPRDAAPADAAGDAEEKRQMREAAAELLSLKKTQLRQETQRHAERNRRRQRARLKAELCYTLNEPVLATVFPRAMFEDFAARYLGDHEDAEAVEENARELEAMILQHVAAQPVPVKPIDLMDLTQWFVEQQQRIQRGEHEHGDKKTQLAGLTRRYTQLAERLIEDEVN
jgi:hypothetical protein